MSGSLCVCSCVAVFCLGHSVSVSQFTCMLRSGRGLFDAVPLSKHLINLLRQLNVA